MLAEKICQSLDAITQHARGSGYSFNGNFGSVTQAAFSAVSESEQRRNNSRGEERTAGDECNFYLASSRVLCTDAAMQHAVGMSGFTFSSALGNKKSAALSSNEKMEKF